MSILKNIFGKKEESIKSYDDFWIWFLKNENIFFKAVQNQKNIEEIFFNKLSAKLEELKDGYFFLTGMATDTVAELIITADGNISNFIFVEELINAAPKINNWKFTAFKPPMDIENVSIKMGNHEFNKENLYFYPNDLTEFPDEIDIRVIHNDLNEKNKTDIINGTNIFLDNYLGEIEYATTIDNLTVIGKHEAEKELIPIEKLKAFIIWRQKEFIEKYEGLRHNTDEDSYTGFEAELQNGDPVIALMNSELLKWDSKASHPWFINLEIKFFAMQNGMPDQQTYDLLDVIENKIIQELKDHEGYLNIGRETSDGIRNIYFACREYKKPSKILHELKISTDRDQFEIGYDIYKDKYWLSLKRFFGAN
jgi:uncharacterized protein DUF695